MENYSPRSGRMLGEDGQTYNIIDLLGGGDPVSAETYDVEQYSPASGRVIGEDGQVYNLVDLLQGVVSSNKVANIEPIADPTSANAEDVAEAFNALIQALKG